MLPYKPQGRVQLPGAEAYSLDDLQTRPMLSLEARWPAWQKQTQNQNLLMGPFFNWAYTQHDLQLRTPTGRDLGKTRLHSSRIVAGLGADWVRSSKWSLPADIGIGRWDSVQSSDSAIANNSRAVDFTMLGAGAQYRFSGSWLTRLSYEYLWPWQEDESFRIPRHNAHFSLLWSVR